MPRGSSAPAVSGGGRALERGPCPPPPRESKESQGLTRLLSPPCAEHKLVLTGVGVLVHMQTLEFPPRAWPEAAVLLDLEFEAAPLGYLVLMRTKCVDSVAFFQALHAEFKGSKGLRYVLPYLFTNSFFVDLAEEPNAHDIVLLLNKTKGDEQRRNSLLIFPMLTKAWGDFEDA